MEKAFIKELPAVVVASHDRTVLRRLAHWPRLDLDVAGRAGVDTL